MRLWPAQTDLCLPQATLTDALAAAIPFTQMSYWTHTLSGTTPPLAADPDPRPVAGMIARILFAGQAWTATPLVPDLSFCDQVIGQYYAFGDGTVTSIACVEDATTGTARFWAWHQRAGGTEQFTREDLAITPTNTIAAFSADADDSRPITAYLNGVVHWPEISPAATRFFTFTPPRQLTWNRGVAGYDLSPTNDFLFVDYY